MRVALALTTAAAFGAAHAQIHVPVYTGTPLLITSGVLNQQIVRSATAPVLNSGGEPGDRGTLKSSSIDTAVTGTSTDYAAKLTQTYPPAQRAQAQRVFDELLAGYQTIESRFGVPRNDLAGAVAAFLAGSFMAYRDTDFPDANFRPLVDQMRGVIASTGEFATATPTQKREMYEQMAILGMFMATTQMALKRQPDPTLQFKLREAARGYFEKFLKIDADKLQITSAGLDVR